MQAADTDTDITGATAAGWAPQSPDLSSYHSGPDNEPEHPQHRGYRGSISLSHSLLSSPSTSSPILHTNHEPRPPSLMPRGVRTEESMQDADYMPDASEKSRGKRKEGNGASSVPATLPPGAENVNITVHFPVARIKRIMQADDDVGKVAQVTPVVVSKALELFMISLVTKAAAEAKARNSKRVGAIHLKQAVTKDEQFDFLNDIVSKVADAPPDKDDMDVDGKKKKPAGRRKKKAESDSP